MMHVCILFASPRKNGNTAAITSIVTEALKNIAAIDFFSLYDLNINPCTACRHCQSVLNDIGCVQQDDMLPIFDSIRKSDLIILASPIYSCFCTAPAKAALDRIVYGFNKFYGPVKGDAMLSGKSMALISTCGYPIEKGKELLEEALRRYCKHSKMTFIGTLCERHLGYQIPFMDEDKAQRANTFAQMLINHINKGDNHG